MTAKELYDLFRATYVVDAGEVTLDAWSVHPDGSGGHRFVCSLRTGDRTGDYEGTGTGPLSAFADALAGAGHPVDVLDFAEHTTDGETTAYAECRVAGTTVWGAGRDASPLAASVQALLSAVNRAERRA